MVYGDTQEISQQAMMRRSSLHMRHDMELCDQSGEDQDKAWLGLMDRLKWRRASQGFEAMDRETVKLGQDLAPMD